MTQSFDVFFDLHLNKRLSKNGEADDLKHHRAHYGVTVMQAKFSNLTNATTLPKVAIPSAAMTKGFLIIEK